MQSTPARPLVRHTTRIPLFRTDESRGRSGIYAKTSKRTLQNCPLFRQWSHPIGKNRDAADAKRVNLTARPRERKRELISKRKRESKSEFFGSEERSILNHSVHVAGIINSLIIERHEECAFPDRLSYFSTYLFTYRPLFVFLSHFVDHCLRFASML